jgi:hypothetical protein
LLEISGFHHNSSNFILGKNICICWIGGRVGQTASLQWKREKYLAPTSIQNTDRLIMAYSLTG